MKVDAKLYETMRKAVQSVFLELKEGKIAELKKSRPEVTDRRIRWDLWFVAYFRLRRDAGLNVYKLGLNDSHIDTALRKITKGWW